jgi:hypothetical protein
MGRGRADLLLGAPGLRPRPQGADPRRALDRRLEPVRRTDLSDPRAPARLDPPLLLPERVQCLLDRAPIRLDLSQGRHLARELAPSPVRGQRTHLSEGRQGPLAPAVAHTANS